MKLQDGQVLFSSYTEWGEMQSFLKKKGKRLVAGTSHTYVKNDKGLSLALPVEDLPKNPPKIKTYPCEVNNDLCQSRCTQSACVL